jgi:hypothetical protein
MVSLETYRKLAAALPGTTEQIHSGMPAFAVGKSRFAIFDPKKGELALKLPPTDAGRRSGIETGLLVPAPGKYGAEGWAGVDMERIGNAEFVELLETAHRGVASTPKTEIVVGKATKARGMSK